VVNGFDLLAKSAQTTEFILGFVDPQADFNFFLLAIFLLFLLRHFLTYVPLIPQLVQLQLIFIHSTRISWEITSILLKFQNYYFFGFFFGNVSTGTKSGYVTFTV
jgi:hypothetical protein